MRRNLSIIFLLLFVFPCCAIAIPINSYINQDIFIGNNSSQDVLVTASSTLLLNNYLLKNMGENKGVQLTYPSDKFTVGAGQSFNHTVDIRSAIDQKLICTVTSSLNISLTSSSFHVLTNTDRVQCHTSVEQISSRETGTLYRFNIEVV